MSREEGRGYWIWPVGPEFYMDHRGQDREALDPALTIDPGSWWTCHPETRRGDLILLWCTTPHNDLRYLAQAASDAYPVNEAGPLRAGRWSHGCDYRTIHKIVRPLPFDDIGDIELPDDPTRQAGIRLSEEAWTHISGLLTKHDPSSTNVLNEIEERGVHQRIAEDEEIVENLANNLDQLRAYGYEMELLDVPGTDGPGRQIICTGQGGRINLLCFDRRGKRNVAIDMTTLRAGQDTLRQMDSIMSWVKERYPTRKTFYFLDTPTPVHGLIISRGCTEDFAEAVDKNRFVRWIDVRHLSLG